MIFLKCCRGFRWEIQSEKTKGKIPVIPEVQPDTVKGRRRKTCQKDVLEERGKIGARLKGNEKERKQDERRKPRSRFKGIDFGRMSPEDGIAGTAFRNADAGPENGKFPSVLQINRGVRSHPDRLNFIPRQKNHLARTELELDSFRGKRHGTGKGAFP